MIQEYEKQEAGIEAIEDCKSDDLRRLSSMIFVKFPISRGIECILLEATRKTFY